MIRKIFIKCTVQVVFMLFSLPLLAQSEGEITAVAPTDVRANPLVFNEVKISWRDRSSDEDNFEIQRSANGVTYVTLATVSANTTSYTDNLLNSNTFYIYRVASVKANNRSAYTLSNSVIDWLLFGEEPAGTEQITPNKPTNFNIENRAWHHVKLSWTDVASETGYRIERSEDGGITFTHTYNIPANHTEDYPYSLKPETNYVFKLYAVNGENSSEPAVAAVTTKARTFPDRYDNFSLWIFDAPVHIYKVKQIGNVAFYLPDGKVESDVDALYYTWYAQNWEYVFSCYPEMSNNTLHVLLYPTYAAYGETAMLKRFWQLQKQYYKMRNGNFQGNSANPGGRGNLGELIHFWSGACQVDMKPFAVKAFGWNEQYEAWWQEARINYPLITYADAPIDSRENNKLTYYLT